LDVKESTVDAFQLERDRSLRQVVGHGCVAGHTAHHGNPSCVAPKARALHWPGKLRQSTALDGAILIEAVPRAPRVSMPSQANVPLPEGYQLQNYRITKVLSAGGFSMVYLAHDEGEQPVAIKEYLPSSLALRNEGDVLPSIAEENVATFRYGMKCFFEEGRALAKLSHPNVVRVLNFFRANETVYLVMRYERGRTLQEHIQARRGAMKENFIRRVFTLLLNGLREVHANKLLHLDIKPANIYIRNDITPVLIDFGAARQTLTAEGFKLNPMYTPGFASPEHYQKRELLGPWSDIYSVGASSLVLPARRRRRRTCGPRRIAMSRRPGYSRIATPTSCWRPSIGV
jgi:serine/threonine protein kinase